MLRKRLSLNTIFDINTSMRKSVVVKRNKNDTAEAVWALTPKDCRWPMGEPKQPGFSFCCETAVANSRYCLEHLRLSLPAYITPAAKSAFVLRHPNR